MVGKRRSKGIKMQSKFVHYLLAPVRALSSARDFYTNTLCGCDGEIVQGSMAVTGYSTLPQVSPLPRSFSGASLVKEGKDIEDLRQLIRVMTIRNIAAGNNRAEADSRRRLRAAMGGGGSGRSYSSGVGRIGRIDEDRPCEFVEVFDGNMNMYPRCGSYALTNTSRNVVD